MKNITAIIVLSVLIFAAGCHSDIVTTRHLKAITDKCVYIEKIETHDPYAGKVLRDVLEKEFIRKQVQICDANSANIILTGSAFATFRSAGNSGMFGSNESSAEAIEAMSITAKDTSGNILLTASYDNAEQFTASKLAQQFGAALANKLK